LSVRPSRETSGIGQDGKSDYLVDEFPAPLRPGVVDVAELLVALPGEGDFVVGVAEGELRVEPGGLFVGEVFGADLQRAADAVERVALAAAVPEGVLLDAAADLIDHG
jgi:hypothetical protein